MKLFTHSLVLKSVTKEINLDKDLRINVSLESDAIITDEVIVTGEKLDKNVSSSKMSQVKIEVNNIKQLPVILGEVDVLKSAQLTTWNYIKWRRKFRIICKRWRTRSKSYSIG